MAAIIARSVIFARPDRLFTAMEPTDLSAPDDTRRFGGIARLYGEAGRARLAAARVCVVGIGGVGSWVAEGLARSGVGKLTLIDLDHVAESNINRQIHAADATLGQAKVEAMRERVAGYNPACQVAVVDDFVTVDNAAQLLAGVAGVPCASISMRSSGAPPSRASENSKGEPSSVISQAGGGQSRVRFAQVRLSRSNVRSRVPPLDSIPTAAQSAFSFCWPSAARVGGGRSIAGTRAASLRAPSVCPDLIRPVLMWKLRERMFERLNKPTGRSCYEFLKGTVKLEPDQILVTVESPIKGAPSLVRSPRCSLDEPPIHLGRLKNVYCLSPSFSIPCAGH